MSSLVDRLESWGAPHMLVVGDVMLDRYTIGDVHRVSPEAPVLVLSANAEEARPGGAASVAALLRGLGARVALAGAIGDDGDGRVLRKLIEEYGVDQTHVVVDDSRRTTVKERILGRTMARPAQQIVRVDYEHRHAISPELEEPLWEKLSGRLREFSVVLISDYAKGFATRSLVSRLIFACRELAIPVLVDPGRGVPYDAYRGATLVKPNRLEAEANTSPQRKRGILTPDDANTNPKRKRGTATPADLITNPPRKQGIATPADANTNPPRQRRILTPDDAIESAKSLRDQFEFGAVIVTLDADGMVLVDSLTARHFPTSRREVCDSTGAGDMVLATLGIAIAENTPLAEAVELANIAAGMQVERQGVAVVTRRELHAELIERSFARTGKIVTLEQTVQLAESYRRRGRRIAFTNGCFDLLHVGHVAYLQEAAALGDVLVVAINSDASVKRLKGASRPVIGQADRAAMLAALCCVGHVLIFEEDTPHRLLEAIRPDVLVKGGTYRIEEVVGRELVEARGGRVCVVGKVPGISTTELIQRMNTSPNTSPTRKRGQTTGEPTDLINSKKE